MKDCERDILRRNILELLSKGCMHYTDLEKKVCASCLPFASTNTFKPQLAYLLKKGFIERVSRGIYQITEKGQKYLVILT